MTRLRSTLPLWTLLVGALATLRLTRLATTDWLGEWLFVRPAKVWAGQREVAEIHRRIDVEIAGKDRTTTTWVNSNGEKVSPADFVMEGYDENDPWTWEGKLVKGLDCPFCVGFWIGLAVLALLPLFQVPVIGHLLRWLFGALALNYVVGHVSSRIDG